MRTGQFVEMVVGSQNFLMIFNLPGNVPAFIIYSIIAFQSEVTPINTCAAMLWCWKASCSLPHSVTHKKYIWKLRKARSTLTCGYRFRRLMDGSLLDKFLIVAIRLMGKLENSGDFPFPMSYYL